MLSEKCPLLLGPYFISRLLLRSKVISPYLKKKCKTSFSNYGQEYRKTGNVLIICTSATRVIKGCLIIAFLPFIQIEIKPMNLRFSARKTKLDD